MNTPWVTGSEPTVRYYAGIFDTGTDMLLGAVVFLAVVAFVAGTLSAISKLRREGAGTAITEQIMVIAFSALIILGSGAVWLFVDEGENHGIHVPAEVKNSKWGQ
ncbi:MULTISPECIES: hypothetical protein [Mycolicibacterium]|uniref:hypothetical protein n=1 Tax=Mycolicibacterium TaxID=1866885 RepID=UPI001E6590F9|nr:hypothetical protein [Mycolicibacterium mageritense]MCC9184370.1 hypothetical protein [Mycolicibacterium mageritense]